MSEQRIAYRDVILRNGLELREDQLARLGEYHNLLLRWNARINLVSRKDEANIWPNHILHSLSLLFEIAVPDGVTVADIGTGGGLPGIPLSIAMPSATVVLIESIRKKCGALEAIVKELGLDNVEIVNARAEDVALQFKHKQFFDIVVSRAVASLRELIAWSGPLSGNRSDSRITLRRPELHGKTIPLPVLIAMKGGHLEQEIAEARKATPTHNIQPFAINFVGINQTNLVDKQIVVVEL